MFCWMSLSNSISLHSGFGNRKKSKAVFRKTDKRRFPSGMTTMGAQSWEEVLFTALKS